MFGIKNKIPELEDDSLENVKSEKGINKDSDEKDYYRHEDVYFVFVDVLGFKNIYDGGKKADGKTSKKISDLYKDVFSCYFDLMNVIDRMKPSCYAGQTSDSLYFYTERVDWLMEYIKIFLHFNLCAMSKNVFFRGGIAKGDLYIKEDYQFYGDSVIHSYLLESDISKNPIVMVDENTYTALKKFSEEETEFLIKTVEGRHYLKVFAPLQRGGEVQWRKDIYKTGVYDEKKIIYNINNNIKKFEYNANLYGKYNFLKKEYEELKRMETGINA